MPRFARAAAAAVLLSGGLVACTVPSAAGPVYCHGKKATIVVTAASPRVVSGTARGDVIVVTGGLHEVHGGAGDDLLCADTIGSTLFGDDGNDGLIGAAGNDRLFGGNGNDTMLGGGGSDLFVGGAGTDTVSYADHDVPVTAAIDDRADSGATNEHDVIDPSVENLTGGSSMNFLTGDSAPNVLIGQSANDRLIGGAGNDVLKGQNGNDTLDGQGGDDTLDGGSGVNGCDLDSADTTTHDCKFDMTPPRVTDFEVLTPTVDITGGHTALTLQAEVTDNLSGVHEVTVQFCDAKGNQDPFLPLSLWMTSGTDKDGIWQATTNLSNFTKAGMYSVCFVNVSDKASNLAFLTNKGLAGSGTLPHGTFGFDVINNRTDTTAPVISNVVTTPSVDVTNGAATVTTDFNVIEDGSGIDFIQFVLRQDSAVANPEALHAEPELVTPSTSGVSGSGRYRAVIQVPQGAAAGRWHVVIYARDVVLNDRSSDTPITVVDRSPASADPRVVSVVRTAGDTSHSQTFSVHLTDARVGVDHFDLQVAGPSSQWAYANFELTSGSALDGVWTATIQLPDSAAAGTWAASGADVYDSLGRYYSVLGAPGWSSWTVS